MRIFDSSVSTGTPAASDNAGTVNSASGSKCSAASDRNSPQDSPNS